MADAFEEWDYPPKLSTPRVDLGGMTLDDLQRLDFSDLGRFKQARKFPQGYSAETLTFYAPRDPGVHEVIIWTLLQATNSVVVNMYGFDDPHAAALIRLHTEIPGV